MGRPPPSIRVVADPTDGATDVLGGRISADSPGGDGGGHERPGSFPGFGLHRDTVRKMLAYSVPPGYRRQGSPRRPKLDPFTGVIDRILDEDHRVPKKQRHTVKRIFERLRDEYGFDGRYTVVKDYVREHRQRTKEMFVPLSHSPGQDQCDFGEALVVNGGVERKAHCFVLDLSHSDGCFVKAYPAETTDSSSIPSTTCRCWSRRPAPWTRRLHIQGWDLPQEFDTLRRLLESRMGRRGKREYVQVLRLLETFSPQEAAAAVKDALRLEALSFDAVKHLVLCRLEGRPPRLDLELYPYLSRVRVGTTSARDYMSLLSGRAA